MCADKLEQVVQRAAAIVFRDLLAIFVDEECREAIDLLDVANFSVLLHRAVNFGNLDVSVSNKLLSQLLPDW